MPRTSLLFCPLSMKNTSPSERNSYGTSHYRTWTMFLFGLLLCIFVPYYAEAAFSAPPGCSSSTWVYQSSKMQNISCINQNLARVPNDSKEGSDVFKLDLSYNQITTLEIDEFQYFINLVVLDLSYNEIPSITVDTFSNLTNLQHLNLAGNDLSYLPSGTFTAISVEIFNVSRNTNLVFGRRTSDTLRVLDLSYLNLGSVTKEHFKNLVNLQEVYLSHNNLTSLDRHLFKDLTSLEIIDLSWNEITELDNNQVYKKCTGLKTLDLSNNIISTVHRDFLNDAAALTNLDLSHNQISDLDQSTFNDLPDLEILYLNDNLLTTIDEDLFEELTSLTTLYLNTNSLASLHADVFKELTSLTTLYLNNNLLTVLPDNLFYYNTGLQYLSLSANKLSTITVGIFAQQSAAFTVDLSGNPFICECAGRDYLYDIKHDTAMTLEYEDSIYCTDASLAQHVYLDYNNVNCSGNLGAACTVTYDCKVRNAQCNNAKCICPDNFYDTNGNTTDGGLCNAKILLDNVCPSMDAACSGSNVECVAKSPSSSDTYCQCKSLYYDDNPQYEGGTCILKAELGEACISINNMCRPDYSTCGTSDTCECQADYYDNDGTSNTGGECLEKLALHSTCNETYQCLPSNSECSNNVCSCETGYYDFTDIGQCKAYNGRYKRDADPLKKYCKKHSIPPHKCRPSGFFSCYPDNSMFSDTVVFDKVKNVTTEEECKNYCFEENVRYYRIEDTITCLCGDVTTAISCCPKVDNTCSGKSYLGPNTGHAEAGINITHVPRLIAGNFHEFSITTNLTAIDQLNVKYGDSVTIETVNASDAAVYHMYTHSGLFWFTVTACASAKGACEDASLPVRVQVPPGNLTVIMIGIGLASVSSDLTSSVRANIPMGHDIDFKWSRTHNGVTTYRKVCKPDYIEHRYSCIRLESTPAVYSSAKTACAADGSLLKIDYMDQLAEVVTALGVSSETVFIGAERVGGLWQWTDGSKTRFSDGVLTDTSNDCAALVGGTAQLTSISCSTSAKYVCMSDPESCPKGGDLLSNGYCYVLSTEPVLQKSWQDANSYCWSEYGGWLTNVTDATVQDKVTSLLTTAGVSDAWIGLNDQQVEGSYLWADYSSFNYENPPYLPPVTSNTGDCFVATNAGNWNSQDCSNVKYFVCQYSENIQRISVPNYIVGSADIHAPAGEDLLHVFATGSFPSQSIALTGVKVFPGLPFSRSGNIREWIFCSDNLSGSSDISFQVYRPICSGYLIQAGCISTMFSSCSSSSQTCVASTGCADTEYFCYLSSSCRSMNESCTCNSVSSSTSGCGTYGTVDGYELVSQTSVTITGTGTGEKCYRVSEGDISIQEGDIPGFQFPSDKNIVRCEDRPSDPDQQTLYHGMSSNWLAKTDRFTTYSVVAQTCDFQVLITEDSEYNLPNNLGYSSSVGDYGMTITTETETKRLNVSLEETISDVNLVYPLLGLANSSDIYLGTVYTELNQEYNFTVAAGGGTNLEATAMGQTVPFTNSCVPAIASIVGDDCNSTLYWSDKPFATFVHNTSAVGTVNTNIMISNRLDSQTYTVTIQTEERISRVALSLVTPSLIANTVAINSPVEFLLNVTGGTGIDISYTVNGTSASSTNASLFHIFPTIGAYTVTGTVANVLDTLNETIIVVAKQPASFNNCRLVGLPYVAAVNISFNLKLECNVTIGAEVSTFWNFSDGTANITSAVSTASSSSKSWTQPITFASVAMVTVIASVKDSFSVVEVSGTVSVYNSVQSVSITSNGTDVLLNTVVEFTVNIAAVPGNYGTVQYIFDFGDGTTQSSSTSVVTHMYTAGSNYTVNVTASNGASSETATTYVTCYQSITGLTFSDDGPKENNTAVTFTASVSTGNFLLYRFFSDPSAFDVTQTSGTYINTFTSVGDYNVSVIVHNMLSQQSESITTHIMNAGDIIITGIEMDGSAVSNCVETTVGRTFEVIVIHYNLAFVVFDWDFGDGTRIPGTTRAKVHSFNVAGNYTINVTARFTPQNAEQNISQEVCFHERITSPTISIASPITLPSSGMASENVTVTVVTGDPLSYDWSTNATGGLSTAAVFPVEFTAEGTYYITVTVSNEVNSETVTKYIVVIEEISGITISCSSCIEQSGEYYLQNGIEYIFNVTTATGSGISFSWDSGDSATATGPVYSHTYTSIGTRNLTVTGTNTVTSAKIKFKTVHVEAPITSVTVVNRLSDWTNNVQNISIKDLNIDKAGKFLATVIPNGMDLEYIWTFESDLAEETTHTNEAEHTYNTTGLKLCTVTAKNSLGNVTSEAFRFYVIQEISDSSLQVTENGNLLSGTNASSTYKVALNKLATFSLSSVEIVQYTVEYFLLIRVSGSLVTSTMDRNDPTLTFNFNLKDIYWLEATATNSLGSASTTVYIETLVAISGPYISATAGEDGNITLGSSLTLTGGVTNGDYPEFYWSYAVAPSVETLPATSMSTLTITPGEVGLYIVTLEVNNSVSTTLRVNYTINVMAEVSGVGIDVAMTYTDAVEVGTNLTFFGNVTSGTDVLYRWDVIVSGSLNGTGNSQSFTYLFSTQAFYNITLSVENYASSGIAFIEIYSLYEVPGFSIVVVSGVSYIQSIGKNVARTNTVVTFSSDISNDDYLQFDWKINGSSEATSKTLQKNFTNAAEYSIELTANNLISSGNSVSAVVVQDPISGFTVDNCIGTYPIDAAITLTASCNGTDISIEWTSAKYGNSTSVATNVQYSTVGTHSINVTGSNLVSREIKYCWITIQGIISNLTLVASQYKYVGYPITFNLTGNYVDPATVTITWVFSHGVTNTTNDATLDLIFATRGNYTLQVTVANAVGHSTQSITIEVEELGCSVPTVTVDGSTERRTRRSSPIEVTVSITTGGCTEHSSVNSWKIYAISSCAVPLTNQYLPPNTTQTNTPGLLLPSNSLPYGNYCFVFKHSYEDTPQVVYRYINLTVVESPITAVLSCGNKCGVRNYPNLTVDASGSYDPDKVPGTNLTYSWNCSQTMGTVAAAQVCSNISAVTTSSATLTGLTLTTGDVYTATVNVAALGRTSGSSTHMITVGTSTAPVVSITCVSCEAREHEYLTSSSSVAFEGKCSSCSSSSVTYQWTVTETATGTTVTVDSSQTTTGTNQENFVLIDSVLEANKAYTFQLAVTVGSETGRAERVLQPSSKPSAGACTVSPSANIVPLFTLVTVSCTNVGDSDTLSAISYKITVKSSTPYKPPVIAYVGPKSEVDLPLAPLPGTSSGTSLGDVELEVVAFNDFEEINDGFQRTLSFEVPTLSSSQNNMVDYIVDQMVSNMKTIVKQNNPPLLLQYCITLLSFLNDLSESDIGTSAQRMAIRDVIATSLSGLPLTSKYNIQQMASAIEYLVEYPDEISLDTLSMALAEIEAMTEQLESTVSKGDDQRDYDSITLIRANSYMQQALTSPSTVTSDSATLAKLGYLSDYVLQVSSSIQTTTYSSAEEQTQALIIKSMEFNTQLILLPLRTQLANEAAKSISTSDYEVVARHVSLDEITQNHYSHVGGMIKVPKDTLSHTNYNEPSVYQIMHFSKVNQYNFGFSNLQLNTGTLSTSFHDLNGDSVSVSGLPGGEEVILHMFPDNVTPYTINDTALRYSSDYNPQLLMNYSSKTLEANKDFEISINMPSGAGIAIHIQILANLTSNNAILKAKLYKNKVLYTASDSDESKRPKTLTSSIMGDPKHDHTDYTFYLAPSDYGDSDAIDIKVRQNVKGDVHIGVYYSQCEFFNVATLQWDKEGCTPQEESISSCIKCACTHMTSFGGSLFVSPDQLDFTDLTEIDIASNPVAIITCSVILGLYIILVIAFRKLDMMDLKRISLIPLCGKDGSFKYEVTIVTGRMPGAGTTAHVGLRLVGEYGKSARQHVSKAGAFQRNCSDTFIIAYDVNLGELKKIQIWHDNRGSSPSWYLSHVIVNDLQTDHKYYFFGNTWLSLEEENGCIQREVKVAGSHEMSKFSHRLKTALFNALADKHLWLSLFNRPAQSRFTRVQRITCCVTILFTFVVVNAMWYGLLKKDNTELGFEGFGWEEVVLALVSNLMVLPVSIGLVFLFKKSRSKSNFFDHVHKPQTAQTLEIENLCENSQGGSFESTNTGAIPYDLDRESTIDSVPHTALGLHRSRHVTKTQRENTDDSITQKRPSVAVTKASSKSPLWNEDNIMKWPDSVTFDDGSDSRPSTGSTMAAGPSVRQPPVKAGGSTPGATKKSKTIQKGDAGQLLEELDKLEHDLKESESRSVKSSGSKKSTSLRRPTMHKSQWGSLEDILQSDDESVAESSGKMKKRGSTTSQSTTGKFNPRADPRINGNNGAWPKSRESEINGDSAQRSGRGITSGLRPGYYSEMTMESRDIKIPVHKEKCTLPPWCIYIAYIICFLLVVFSTIIVILYCFKFGSQESLKWVLALILSLILSFLVIEPLKALLIAVYVVATFKNVEQDEDDDFIDIEPTFDNSNEKIKDVKFKPISGFALLQAKEEGRKIHRMNIMIRQFIAYIFYLWLIMVVVYVNFRYDTYLMTKHVENDFIAPTTNDHLNFTNITTIDEFWDWTETVFVDSLYKENNTQDEEHAFLLGEARMRLIRGVTAKCQAANAASGLGVSTLTDRTCYGQGNYDEDTSDYAEGWNDSNSNYSWRHYSAGDLGSTHKIGHVATYGGGGYPHGLGTSSAETDSIIAYLKDKGWIDLQTRAIIFEFALYSAGSDMTSMVALLAEFPLTGGVITSYEIQSQKLLWFQENTVEPLMVLEVILFLVIVYSVIHIALQIREQGKPFFKDIWNWYEMLTTLMALVSVGMYIGCVVEATNTFNRFLDNQTGFTNFERAMYVHVGMRYLHAWLLFLLMFKVVKQLRFIKFMYIYERTLSKAVGHLLGTGLIYIILLLVYAQVGYLMYGQIVSGFESVGHSITTLIVMIRGSFDFWPMLDHQPVFSHFYVYSYYAFAYGIMIALVISILTSTYKVIKSQMYYKATLEMQDYEMIDFMLKRLKLLTGIQKPKPAFRRVRFPGLPSVSSRASSSYSSRSSASLHSAESIDGQQFSEVQLRSMMARMAPTWQAVLRRMDKIVALDDEEESLVKKAENEMKNLNWKCRINELERQHKEILSWKDQPSTSDKPPPGDSKQRQSILKRPGASKDNQDRKAPATVSGAPSRTAASTPADDNNGAQGRRPLSDQGVRVEQASTSKRRASSNEKSKIQTFYKSIKPSKSAWNK